MTAYIKAQGGEGFRKRPGKDRDSEKNRDPEKKGNGQET